MNAVLNVKKIFLDRPAVINAVDRAAHQALNRVGGRTRKTMQRSMRYVTPPKSGKPRKVSPPGAPPRAVRSHPWIRKHTYYAWDPEKKSVVVGPIRFGPKSGAPRRLEHGGRVRMRNPRRTIRRVGDGGEVGLGGSGPTVKPTYDWRGKKVLVRYGKLHTESQARRANELQELIYGPLEWDATIEPRPFAGPALEKMMPELPKELAGTVRP